MAKGSGVLTVKTPEERFWAKVEKTESCWLWKAARTKGGYGVFNFGNGLCSSAHRFSWELVNEPITDGLELNHLCHIRHCVNPAHLELADKNKNGAYRKGPTIRSKSGIRDVFWWEDKQRWVGRVRYKGKDYSTGVKHTKEEAEQAVIKLREQVFGFSDFDPNEYKSDRIKA